MVYWFGFFFFFSPGLEISPLLSQLAQSSPMGVPSFPLALVGALGENISLLQENPYNKLRQREACQRIPSLYAGPVGAGLMV